MSRRSSPPTAQRRSARKAAETISAPSPAPNPGVWRWAAVLVLLGSLAYANSLHGSFVIDDTITIVENPDIRSPWSMSLLRSPWGESAVLGRPLVALTFALNYALHGLDVRGYHLVNIAVHLLCTLVLFGLIRRLRGSTRFAFACASLWMLHPLNSEVVNYISQRTESMMALFYLLTIYASVRAHAAARAWPWLAGAVTASALGTLSKQSMVTVPLALVLVDYAFLFDSLRAAIRSRWRLYVAVTAASWLVVTATVLATPPSHTVGFESGVSPWVYLLNQSVIITQYLTLAIWPRTLVAEYGSPVQYTLSDVLPQMAFVGGLFVLAAVALRYRRTLGLLGMWVFVTLGVTSSVAPIATQVGAERRMYLPLAAVVVLGVAALAWWSHLLTRHRLLTARAVTVGAIVLWAATATALGARTALRNRDYSSALRLAEVDVERRPTARATHGLGAQLLIAGRHDEAIAYLHEAIRGDPRAYYTLGQALFAVGRVQAAREHLETFVRLRPMLAEAVEARAMIGRVLLAEGRLDEAAEQFGLILRMRPSFLDAHLGFAEVFAAQERHDDAAAHLRAYLARGGTTSGVWTALGVTLAQSGRTDEAIDALRRATDFRPDDHVAHRTLATMLMTRQEVTAAAHHARRAVALKPADAASRDLLGIALAALGQPDLAAVQFREALRIDPSDHTVRERLAQVRRQ